MSAQTILSISSLVVSIVAAIATISIYRNSRKLGIKPVLVFLRRSSHAWELANIGTGPALRVLVGEWRWDTDRWSQFTNFYPIPAGRHIDANWLDAKILGVEYEDVDGRRYTTSCQYDRNQVTSGHSYTPEWRELEDGSVLNEHERRRQH